MDENNRSIAKRQIARLLGNSSLPICVISEEDTIVFANEALGRLVGRTPDSILGLRCSSPLSEDGDAMAELSTFFALPIHWPRNSLVLAPEFGPVPGTTNSKTENKAKLDVPEWMRCLIPLEDEAGCVLCVFCPNPNDELTRFTSEQSSLNMKSLRENRSKYVHLDDMWYMQGKSTAVHQALEQVQLAIANTAPLIVLGQVGSGRTWLAETIHARRKGLKRHERTYSMNDSLIRIDCSLMDADLLQSMLEVIQEGNAERTTILLDSLELLPDECISRLESFLKSHPEVIRIATCDPTVIAQKCDRQWTSLRSRLSVVRVDLPRLSERLEDVPILIAAWFDTRRASGVAKREVSDSFVDALTAYPWPGGVEEFSNAIAHATKSVSREKLTDKDLPVNIRTCVSHIELSGAGESGAVESVDLDAILEDVEKTMILRAMERFPQNKSSAAKILNISRARLLRRLQQWGLQSESNSVDGDDDSPVFNEVL
jgi:DNA-binding NtrC family response regulator